MKNSYLVKVFSLKDLHLEGISKSKMEPIIKDGKLIERLILPFSISYDHRVIDGADAARFTTKFGNYLLKFKSIN